MGLLDAHCHDWHGICGAGIRRLFCGFRPPGHLRGQGWRQDRRLAPRRNPDFRARPGCAGRFQCESRASGFCHRSRGAGHADLSYVHSAAREIAAVLAGFTVVVTKSTVPVGTGDEVERLIYETNPSADVVVASNPEFLREGAAIRDFKFPDRIVVGTSDDRARKVLGDIYRPLSLNQAPLMFTARRTAELIKYAANAFLATKITFINEIADLAEKVGADVQEIARGIGLDNRIGSKFLHAGPGFGGSCFPKDTRALVKIAQDHD